MQIKINLKRYSKPSPKSIRASKEVLSHGVNDVPDSLYHEDPLFRASLQSLASKNVAQYKPPSSDPPLADVEVSADVTIDTNLEV